MNCPECSVTDALCKVRFDEFLVLEFTNADYGAVHHLTVTAHMLRHFSKLTCKGWLHMRGLLREFLVENKPSKFVRKQNRDLVDSGKRKFKISSKDGLPVIKKSMWTETILDVRTENADVYCEDVTAWARAVLGEATGLNV